MAQLVHDVGILATNFTLGSEAITYEELEERFGKENMAKVFSGSGIKSRKVAAAGVTGSDLAFESARGLINYFAVDPESIDLLVHCTQSPDYLLPTTACILQERLGIKNDCACFDINLGCSQYMYGLAVVRSMIGAGISSRALLLTGDTMSHLAHPMDRSTVPLLGDAGSATLIGKVEEGAGFIGFELGTDGSGHQYLIQPAGGARQPVDENSKIASTDEDGNQRAPINIYMKGTAIFHFAITVVPPTINKLLAKLNLSMQDVDLFLFHQANRYMLDYLFKKLKIPTEKTHLFVEDIGNTSGSTIPLLLTDAWRSGKVKPGSVILAIGFGVGLSWGATVIRWPKETLGPVPANR